MRRAQARRAGAAGVALSIVGVVVLAGTAGAMVPSQLPVGAPPSTSSDPRATFVSGNATLCADVGFPNANQVGAPENNSASDDNVSGTAGPNAGTVQPGQGEEVNVTITNPVTAIDAVVVKGGSGYNVYSSPAVLPPTLLAPQHYISPFNGGGNVPDLSHWFICYHLTTPPPPPPPNTGALIVRKTVVWPSGPTVDPLPTSVSMVVNCNDGNPAHQNVVVTFTQGGGAKALPILTGIPVGTVCTVVEQNTSTFPPGTKVTYTPPGADNPGITIQANTVATVTVTNDLSGLVIQSANLQLVKVVVPAPPGVSLPASYTARVLCDDGTSADVTLPGTGGPGTPTVGVTPGATCTLGEDLTPLPAGSVVTYSVNGGAASSTLPVFTVTGSATLSVTITNDPSAVTTIPTTIPPTAAPSSEAPTMPSTLPPTGASTNTPMFIGAVLLLLGLLAVVPATRYRSRQGEDA